MYRNLHFPEYMLYFNEKFLKTTFKHWFQCVVLWRHSTNANVLPPWSSAEETKVEKIFEVTNTQRIGAHNSKRWGNPQAERTPHRGRQKQCPPQSDEGLGINIKQTRRRESRPCGHVSILTVPGEMPYPRVGRHLSPLQQFTSAYTSPWRAGTVPCSRMRPQGPVGWAEMLMLEERGPWGPAGQAWGLGQQKSLQSWSGFLLCLVSGRN